MSFKLKLKEFIFSHRGTGNILLLLATMCLTTLGLFISYDSEKWLNGNLYQPFSQLINEIDPKNTFTVPIQFYFIISILMIAVGSFGFFTAVTKHGRALSFFELLMVLLFASQFITVLILNSLPLIFLESYSYKISKYISNSYTGALSNGKASAFETFLDDLQQKGKCCGLAHYLEYTTCPMNRNVRCTSWPGDCESARNEPFLIPYSCCDESKKYKKCQRQFLYHINHKLKRQYFFSKSVITSKKNLIRKQYEEHLQFPIKLNFTVQLNISESKNDNMNDTNDNGNKNNNELETPEYLFRTPCRKVFKEYILEKLHFANFALLGSLVMDIIILGSIGHLQAKYKQYLDIGAMVLKKKSAGSNKGKSAGDKGEDVSMEEIKVVTSIHSDM